MKSLFNSAVVFKNRCSILTLIVIIAGCQSSQNTPGVEEIFPSPTTSAITLPTTSVTATATFSPAPEIRPTIGDQVPFLQPVELLTADFTDEDFQDLIIFSSLRPGIAAFANFQFGIRWAESQEPHIYAFAPDGQRAGTLIPSNFVSAIYRPPNSAGKPMLVEYGVEFNHPDVQGIELPTECYQPRPGEDRLFACGNFQFSPDGQYLGFFYGPYECWRGIIVQNTQNGEQLYHSKSQNGHAFQLFEDGNALISTGHCQGGGVTYYDFDDQKEIGLGSEGVQTWNADKTAFAVEAGSYAGIDTNIWAYNLETEQLFMKRLVQPQIDDHAVWTPDKRYLIYQHRTLTWAAEGYPTSFDTARQIILVDAQIGDQKKLLADPAYDFHIGSCPTCAQWYGDWIQIRRVAFEPEDIKIKVGSDIYRSQEYTCRVYGENCASPVELFALNWKSGELRTWSEAIQAGLVPGPELTATPLGPDPSQPPMYEQPQGQYTLYAGPQENTFWVDWRWGGEGQNIFLSGPDLATEPVYENPSKLYAYYLGIDGKSLWMVPNKGTPLPWVLDGQNYFYLDKK